MNQDIDALIAKKEAELCPFSDLMEKLKDEFIKETISFAKDWYMKTIKEYITKYPGVTLKMKEENISSMKANLNDLVSNAEKIVKTSVDKPSVWWHKKPRHSSSVDQYTQVADKYPEILDSAIRNALGHLGPILQEFGFHVTANGNSGEFAEFWFIHPANTDQTLPYYPHLLEWSKEMQETIYEYNLRYTPALAIFKEIHELKEEKKRQQALARWDST